MEVKELKNDHDYDTIADELNEFIGEQGVKLHMGEMQNKLVTVNGLDCRQIIAQGDDKSGFVKVNLFMCDTKKQKAVVFFYWGNEAGGQKTWCRRQQQPEQHQAGAMSGANGTRANDAIVSAQQRPRKP